MGLGQYNSVIGEPVLRLILKIMRFIVGVPVNFINKIQTQSIIFAHFLYQYVCVCKHFKNQIISFYIQFLLNQIFKKLQAEIASKKDKLNVLNKIYNVYCLNKTYIKKNQLTIDPADCAIVCEECCKLDPSLVVVVVVVVDGLAVGRNTTAGVCGSGVSTIQSLKY